MCIFEWRLHSITLQSVPTKQNKTLNPTRGFLNCVCGALQNSSLHLLSFVRRALRAFEPKEKRPLRVFGGGGVFCRWLCVLSLLACPKDREGGKSLVFSSSRDILRRSRGLLRSV